ncbi:MAG: DNA polymerase Y family protein [Bacteroidetes bacterium]|nr:MAG: DNA polymerase Y family protein [Bacteroidota bacterium]TAF89978.1 MAG: DNA polymerase Y family protein [Bacteroidota bacterium]
MLEQYVVIWFPYLVVNWLQVRNTQWLGMPIVLYQTVKNRMVVTHYNRLAQQNGITLGMPLADARAILPSLLVLQEPAENAATILPNIAQWFIRYSPEIAICEPDKIIINASGCCHLWGGSQAYVQHIQNRLTVLGYTIRLALAGTIGMAWAQCVYGASGTVIPNGQERQALASLPPQALRIPTAVVGKLYNLGIHSIQALSVLPPYTLRRRFGAGVMQQLYYALGTLPEPFVPIQPVHTYKEFLYCLEPIVTATGIEIAFKNLIEKLCTALQKNGVGIRTCVCQCFRVDGKVQTVQIACTKATVNQVHIFKLLELHISSIEPALGIELFTLHATQVEAYVPMQDQFFHAHAYSIESDAVAQLLDTIANKIGKNTIALYQPAQHYWPERSIQATTQPTNEVATPWLKLQNRPTILLSKPVPIGVTAPVPDYPPMNFKYQGKLHKITRADGPERIEQEWWLQTGEHRDYYYVEDEHGARYWLFRLGHYDAQKNNQWFLHGYCA